MEVGQENYIAIFTSELANLLQEGQFSPNDVWYMIEEFKLVAETINSRLDLLNFIEKYIIDYPELAKLKNNLLDRNYKFNS